MLDAAVDNIDSTRFDEDAPANSERPPDKTFVANKEVAPPKTGPTAHDGS